MPTIKTKTTYVEMLTPPAARLSPPCAGVDIVSRTAPGNDEYLEWYQEVGQAWHWIDRIAMSPEVLRQHLDDPGIEVLVLRVDQQPAGFVEIDFRNKEDVEIAYFGLYPSFIGRGLGKYFLNEIAHRVWQRTPTRLWLHTCDLDSQAALPNYLQAGFQIFDEKLVDKVMP